MLSVAGIARSGRRNQVALIALKIKERPLVRKMRGILNMHLEAHLVRALVVAALIDRTLAFSPANLKHQDCLVGPGPRLNERPISFGIDEHVVEHLSLIHISEPTRR